MVSISWSSDLPSGPASGHWKAILSLKAWDGAPLYLVFLCPPVSHDSNCLTAWCTGLIALRFLLHYDTQNPSSLVPLASGDNPSIPQIREHLSNSSENLVYGYADIQGKGLVLAYMAEGVG